MPQIHVTLSPRTSALFTEAEVSQLDRRFAPIVERIFGIEGENDTAFTAVRAMQTRGEADFQVEIRYTVGVDEYGLGKPFNPSLRQQKALVDAIEKEFGEFLTANGLSDETLSVWCIPCRGGYFRMCKKSK